MKQNKRIIGVTGGVGCGKSTIMNLLQERFGARILLADQLGHCAMKKGEESYDKICRLFGNRAVLQNGELDRSYLAQIIYKDAGKRNELNQIIHPYVKQKMREYLKEWENEPLVAIETAIMYETGCDELCDTVWYVYTDPENRIRRLRESRGYSREKAEEIMAVQISDEEGRRMADAWIDNNGPIEKITDRLQELLGISAKR